MIEIKQMMEMALIGKCLNVLVVLKQKFFHWIPGQARNDDRFNVIPTKAGGVVHGCTVYGAKDVIQLWKVTLMKTDLFSLDSGSSPE